MRDPKIIKVIILGLKKSDEYDYFCDTQAFIKKENPPDFPLNQIGQSLGIYLSRLEKYVQIKKKYLLKEIKGKFMFSFYNYNTKTFHHTNTLLKDGSNFIFLNFEICDDQKPLLVRLIDINKIQRKIRRKDIQNKIQSNYKKNEYYQTFKHLKSIQKFKY